MMMLDQIEKAELTTSKRGYPFNPKDHYWVLDKNTQIAVGTVTDLLDLSIKDGYIKTLTHYATTLSASHVKNINERFLHFLRATSSTIITDINLINYKAN